MICIPSLYAARLDRSFPGWQENYKNFLSGKEATLDRAGEFLTKVYYLEGRQVMRLAPLVQALYLWLQEQRIYRYAKELALDLIAAGSGIQPEQEFPLSVFRNLPDTCIYLSAPDALHGIFDGFLMHREGTGVYLTFLPTDAVGFFSGKLFLSDKIPVKKCLPNSRFLLADTAALAAHQDELCLRLLGLSASAITDSVLQDLFLRSLQLGLYLVSQKADIVLKETPGIAGGNEYHVGYRMSSEIAGGKRATHIRRGHWHKYWTGPKSGQQQAVIRWVDAVTVGGADNVSQ